VTVPPGAASWVSKAGHAARDAHVEAGKEDRCVAGRRGRPLASVTVTSCPSVTIERRAGKPASCAERARNRRRREAGGSARATVAPRIHHLPVGLGQVCLLRGQV